MLSSRAGNVQSREAESGDIDRDENRFGMGGAVDLPAQRLSLRGHLDAVEIPVMGQIVRRRYTTDDRRAVVHAADQAFTIDMEDLLGAVRCNVIRERDLEPPAP